MNIEFYIEKYSKLVYKICFDILSDTKDAEDMTQETYLSLYNSFERYSSLKENEVKNIICKIALNKCKDFLKSNVGKVKRNTSDDQEILDIYKSKDSIEEKIENEDNIRYLREKINKLNEPYKTIIFEYYIKGKSLDELAIDQRVRKSTLKTQIYRAKEILRKQIVKDGGDKFL